MNKSILITFILIIVVAVVLTARKETVGVDQIGVRYLLGTSKTFQAGETAIMLPFVSNFIRMSANPIQMMMAGVSAVPFPVADGKTTPVECKIFYQIQKPALTLDRFGKEDPQQGINDVIRKKVTEIILTRAEEQGFNFEEVPSRLLLAGEILGALNDEALTPGVKVVSFELLNW